MERVTQRYEFLTPSSLSKHPPEMTKACWLWEGLKENTTAHGIPHIDTARGKVKKVFWILVTLVTLAAFAYSVYNVFYIYFRYDVNVNVIIQPQGKAVFPAVTVCNMSPVKQSALTTSPALQSVLGGTSRKKRDVTHSRVKRSYPFHTCNNQTIEPTSGFCFTLYSDEKYERNEALSKCNSVGMSLAVIASPEAIAWQNNQQTLQSASSDRAWIGLLESNNKYYWGENQVSYNNWESGQPDRTRSCVTLDRRKSYQWKTEDCTKDRLALCSKYMGVTAVPGTTIASETTTSSTVQTTGFYSLPSTMHTTESTTGPSTVQVTTTYISSEGTTEQSSIRSTTVTTEPSTMKSTYPETTVKTTTDPPGPQPIPGSKFPERILTRESFAKEEQVTEVLADLPEEEKKALGFRQSEFILSCKYDGSSCKDDAFTFFYNTVHGNCYIFNSGWKSNRSVYTLSKIGRKNGLSLVLNIGQDEYVEAIGDSAGARVVIHDQEKMPFPEEEGILVSPGYATSVGIKKVQIVRMPDPYGDCVDPTLPRHHLNVFEEKFPVKYSTLACFKTCYQSHVIKRCGCADSMVPKYGNAFNYDNVRTCDIKNITQDDCRYEVNKMYRENQIKCDCPRSCRESNYQTLYTRAQWPSDTYRDALRKQFSGVVPTLFNDPNDTKKYERNVLRVDVFYQDMNLKSVEEKPAYGEEKLFSDVGGLLGLLAGFSVLTIFEFFEFFMDMLALPCIKRRNINQTDVTSSEENKLATKKEAFVEPQDARMRKRRASYRPSYIKQSAFTRQDKYADLFDLNH